MLATKGPSAMAVTRRPVPLVAVFQHTLSRRVTPTPESQAASAAVVWAIICSAIAELKFSNALKAPLCSILSRRTMASALLTSTPSSLLELMRGKGSVGAVHVDRVRDGQPLRAKVVVAGVDDHLLGVHRDDLDGALRGAGPFMFAGSGSCSCSSSRIPSATRKHHCGCRRGSDQDRDGCHRRRDAPRPRLTTSPPWLKPLGQRENIAQPPLRARPAERPFGTASLSQ